jgi:hypothetical protein
MQTQKTNRPAFQSVELDPIDVRLEAKAAEKGVPTDMPDGDHLLRRAGLDRDPSIVGHLDIERLHPRSWRAQGRTPCSAAPALGHRRSNRCRR